jgi:hypothetical protein
LGPEGPRHERAKRVLDAVGVALAREAEAARDAADVGVDREGLVGAEVDEDDAGRLPADPGERLERGPLARHASAVQRRDDLHGLDDAPRLGAEEPERADVWPQLLRARPGVRRRVRVPREERRRDEVHTRVGRLRGEDHRDEELNVVAELERDARLRHRAREALDDL